MSIVKFLSAKEAVNLIKDEDSLVTEGFFGSGCPEALNRALEKRFLETGHPKNLTLLFGAAQGNKNGKGTDHLAHEGLLKKIIGSHWNLAPKLGELVTNNKVEAYDIPLGTLTQYFRDIAGKKVGTITHVGLNTFADPRIEGGRLNSITKKDIVKLIHINGRELLFYESIPVNACFIRGSYADENGNITLENGISTYAATSVAQAVKNNGGSVIVQVRKVVAANSLDPRLVKIPGAYVSAVVVSGAEDNEQSFTCEFNPAVTGEKKFPLNNIKNTPLDQRKIIARRAAMELTKGSIVNLGVGIPEGISAVANEEDIGEYMTLTVEAGAVGGAPQGGLAFGSSINPDSLLDMPYQFDFYDGGGLDAAFLGLAQADEEGNINVSRFGPRITGCGGFIDITQNAKKVLFCGTFTVGGLKVKTGNGKLEILNEGKIKKFLKHVEQITFSGKYAQKTKQPVLYITERAVFELKEDGLYLTEIAPGIDIKKDILDLMDFAPKIDGTPKFMDERIFYDKPMGLKK